MSTNFQAVSEAGVEALRRGDAREARAAFDRVEAAGQGSHQIRLFQAQACMMIGDAEAAHRALDKVIAEEPTNLYALIMRGDLLAGAGNDRAAVSWYQAALLQAPRVGPLPQDLIDTLRRVEAEVARLGGGFAAKLESSLSAAGISAAATGRRFVEALDLLMGRAVVQLQQPTNFYYPQLPQRPFFEREEFTWLEKMEAAAPAIRAELEALLVSETGLVPYVAADSDRPAKRHALLDDPRWSAFHLFRGGAPVPENAVRCPATMAALAEVPMPRVEGRAPIAMFSVLRAGTHIPPHNGMINTRLICHLPIIVPKGCRLRVGNEIRPVEPGRMIIFDDSIEHEAWNDGDATRVILLFEIWRPELDDKEVAALTALFEAIHAYAPAEQDQAGA